jgi:hypothetical protein
MTIYILYYHTIIHSKKIHRLFRKLFHIILIKNLSGLEIIKIDLNFSYNFNFNYK